MAPRTREDLRKEAGERRVDPASLSSPKDISLAAEAARIRQGIGDDDDDGILTPAQEAEAEMAALEQMPKFKAEVTNQPSGIDTKMTGAQRLRERLTTKQQAVAHSTIYVDMIQSAYDDFQRRGFDAKTSRALTQAYVIAEMADVLAAIAKKF